VAFNGVPLEGCTLANQVFGTSIAITCHNDKSKENHMEGCHDEIQSGAFLGTGINQRIMSKKKTTTPLEFTEFLNKQLEENKKGKRN